MYAHTFCQFATYLPPTSWRTGKKKTKKKPQHVMPISTYFHIFLFFPIFSPQTKGMKMKVFLSLFLT